MEPIENKLELKYLAAYLQHGVLVWQPEAEGNNCFKLDIEGLRIIEVNGFEGFQLMLRPISFYFDINSGAMKDLNCDLLTQIQINEIATKCISIGDLYYSTVEVCLKNHIDIFGLIEKGLAVPLN